MEGVANAPHEAFLTISLEVPAGQTREIAAVIDTGFTGFLTVTPVLAVNWGYRSRVLPARRLPMAGRRHSLTMGWPSCGMAGLGMWRRMPMT